MRTKGGGVTNAEDQLGVVGPTVRPASGEPGPDRREWLGHRDLCPVAWGEDCDCFCSDKSCDGVLNCEDPACPIAAYLKTQ